jgi:hypothetical protein
MTAIEITQQVTNVAFEITQSDGVVIEVAPVANTVVIEVSMAVGVNEWVQIVDKYIDIGHVSSVKPKIFIVEKDETNGGERTIYLWDGINIKWLITQDV